MDNSVYLSSGDTAGLERLAEYVLRCPFSLARVVRLTDDGSVIYHAEKDHCGRFPGPASADLRGGPRRNFQVFSALDFLAEVTQHIPDKGEHLVRFSFIERRQQDVIERTLRHFGLWEGPLRTLAHPRAPQHLPSPTRTNRGSCS